MIRSAKWFVLPLTLIVGSVALDAPAIQADTVLIVDSTAMTGGDCAVIGNCTLPAALAAASAGAIINLPAGTFTVTGAALVVPVGAAVTITGTGAGTTIINGDGSSRLMEADGGSLTLSGLTLSGGFSSAAGAGALFATGTALTLTSVTVSGNGANGDGGAIGLVRGSLNLNQSTLSNNNGQNGGAVFAAEAPITISATTFDTNGGSQAAGAVFASYPNGFHITGSAFTGNGATTDGGAVEIEGAGEPGPADTISTSTFTSNQAGHLGGAVFVKAASTTTAAGLTIDGSTFTSNTAEAGGAIAIEDPPITVTASTFSSNSSEADGGAIAAAAPVIIGGSQFTGNHSGGSGGAISTSDALTVTTTNFDSNHANGSGGAFELIGPPPNISATYNANTADDGGPIALWTGSTALTLPGTVIADIAAPIVVPAPTVTGFSPIAAQVGAGVRITGAHITGVATVKFGVVPSKSVHVVATNTIVAIVPAGAQSGRITVTTPGGQALTAGSFTLASAPTQVAAGAAHSCARLANGTVACWGLNSSGQLGNGTTTTSKIPLLVPGLTGVTQVAAGGAFSCARTTIGGVKCWGANLNGQLGRGTTATSKTPVPVLTAGTTALTGVSSVSTGASFACAVVTAGASGKVKCWGANSAGQLGDGTMTQRTRPVTVLTAAGKPLNGVVSVDAGGSTACAVVTTGAVRCWGNNNHGQLGRGNLVNSRYAVAVSGLTGVTTKAKSVTVGTAHACAVLTSGAVRCWGLNSTGQLGDGTLLQRAAPVAVKVTTAGALTGVASVTAGGAHTCAVIGAGAAARVRCWGADTTGQLGNTATGVQKFAVLTAGILTNGASSLSAGTAHTLVVATNALIPPTAIVGWGANSSGQLGDTTSTNRVAPVLNPVL